MEFKVNSKQLEKLLTKIIPAVPSRTPMPVLENFLIEVENGRLTIYATDLEISLKSSLDIVVDENIKIITQAKLLYEIVRSLGDTTIRFEVTKNGKINLFTENGEFTLSYLSSDDFPDIPNFPGNMEDESNQFHKLVVKGDELKNAYEKTAFAISKEEMRPAMMGVLLKFCENGLRFVTTDGHRLVNLLLKNIDHSVIDEQFIVPERAVLVLLKILDDKDVKIYLNKTHVAFSLNEIELISRLIAQKYPDYESVIPYENEFQLKVKTKELLNVIKRMILFSPTNSRRVKFSINESILEISAEDIDLGSSAKEKVNCEYSGNNMDIGFNSTYVNDVLSHLTSEEEIIFKLQSSTKAVIINPSIEKENRDLMMLLMPVRLNN